MSTFSDISTGMAEVVSNASESIVRVEARRRLPATGIIWSADGIIVTANHVVRKEEGIGIGLPDGTTTTATLLGRDPATDIAVLKVDASDLVPITEANKQELGVGNIILALGRPGKTVQATLGIISALGGSWRTGRGGQIDRYLQTDVVMYPGFSGGPLVDASGHLVGLNTSALARGVSVSVPTATVARVIASLEEHGRIRRGYLGVSTQRAKLPEAIRGELHQKRGLLIVSVESDSPADKAGLLLGDTIVSMGGEAVHGHDDLLAQLNSDVVGTAVAVQIVRGGKLETVDIVIGERN